MNSLGHIKSILEIEMLQNMSSKDASNIASPSGLKFNDILQQAVIQSSKMDHMSLNALGTVFSTVMHTQTEQAVQNPIPIVTVPKEKPSMVRSYDKIIENAANIYKIPKKLIQAIIKHESNFNPNAISHAGASGLMQLMPATAKWLGVQNIFDPEQNIMGGSKYIRQMLDQFDGDLKLALAAYNAGPGNVNKYGGVPPFKETQHYVQKVLGTYYS